MASADPAPTKLDLPQVTLCAASSVNLAATVRALQASLAQVRFGACKLFTDARPENLPSGIELVSIPRLRSAADYSQFILSGMVDHVDTSHCLVAQWDGHVSQSANWRAEFLDCDYIGAVWPQFDDGHQVGNGGFSLRSRRLLQVCREPEFQPSHPEDVCIARHNRRWLEGRGMRFADVALAQAFSSERVGEPQTSFGYHGVWHMPAVLGAEAFWQVYESLDDRGTIRHDLSDLIRQVASGQGGIRRALRLATDRISDAFNTGAKRP